MKAAIPIALILELIKLIGCPIAKSQCPKVFKKEDCDTVLGMVC